VSSVLVILGLILLLLPAGLAAPVALMTDATADLLLDILRFCDRLPGNFVITARLPLILILLFYAAVMLLPLLKQKQAARVTVALALCLTLMTGFAAVYEKPARGFEVHVLDVGMGNSTLIRTGDENILIDSGRPYATENAVLPYLRSLGIRQLDAIFYSHADSDHMGGNRMLLEAYPGAKIYLPRVQDGRFLYLESLGATHLRQGDRVEFEGITVDVLHPTDSRIMEPLDKRNEYSLVLRVSNGTNQVVLMGDYEGLPVPFGPKCDMIVLPHHGADFETLERLLVLADPACAVLSVGRDNDYGLPETGTIATLEKLKIPTRRTDRDGAIIYRADRGQITVWSAGKETLHGIANG